MPVDLQSFVLVMALYSEAQRRAQEEIDLLLDYGHLSDFSGRGRLTLRQNCVASPLG